MKRAVLIALALTLLVSLALPMTAMAKTNWDLEGWRIDANKWMDGLLFTYHEDDWVQYRLKATRYNGDDTTITIRHDYRDADGAYGVDDVGDFFIGTQTKRTEDMSYVTPIPGTAGLFTVTPWTEDPVPNGSELRFSFNVPNPAPLIAAVEAEVGSADFAFYWTAHLAVTDLPDTLGSSYWNGASLHAHTSVTGNQDVPIKTPPQEAPPPPPCIDVVKYVKVNSLVDWDDSDTSPGPDFYSADNPVQFKIVVTNCGETTLENIQLTDVLYKDGTQIETSDIIPNKTTLAPGEFDEIYLSYTASGCIYENVVIAVGICAESGTPVQDVDSAWFHFRY
jgi:hypothetical protein